MTFTTPCFVRVENAEEREELVKWCTEIGYHFLHTPPEHEYGECVVCDDECVGYAVLSHVDEFANCDFIDCGTDVSLFKALSAMNDENDREQWFTDGIHFENSTRDVAGIESWKACYHTTPRKATVEEIIEHFKSKK